MICKRGDNNEKASVIISCKGRFSKDNRFFAVFNWCRIYIDTARIQRDRNQKVCTTGPYRIARHPAYSGLILNCIGLSLIFPYDSVWICMAITAVIIVIRTAL